jgi:hypothetical protein
MKTEQKKPLFNLNGRDSKSSTSTNKGNNNYLAKPNDQMGINNKGSDQGNNNNINNLRPGRSTVETSSRHNIDINENHSVTDSSSSLASE